MERRPLTYSLSSNLNILIPEYNICPPFSFPTRFGNNTGPLEPMYVKRLSWRKGPNATCRWKRQNAPAPTMGLIQPRWYHGIGRNKLWVTEGQSHRDKWLRKGWRDTTPVLVIPSQLIISELPMQPNTTERAIQYCKGEVG